MALVFQFAFSATLIILPLWPSLRGEEAPTAAGLTIPSLRNVAPGLVLAATLLPLFHLGSKAGYWPTRSSSFHLTSGKVLTFSLLHFLEVILPEELFFRGYLQRYWDNQGGVHFLGIRWHRGLWLQALAFGLVHVVARGGAMGTMDRALPGVAFGFLRESTGALWSPAVFHLACNLYVYLV
jgi:membrane protease YdiL (CAAX protease family)